MTVDIGQVGTVHPPSQPRLYLGEAPGQNMAILHPPVGPKCQDRRPTVSPIEQPHDSHFLGYDADPEAWRAHVWFDGNSCDSADAIWLLLKTVLTEVTVSGIANASPVMSRNNDDPLDTAFKDTLKSRSLFMQETLISIDKGRSRTAYHPRAHQHEEAHRHGC